MSIDLTIPTPNFKNFVKNLRRPSLVNNNNKETIKQKLKSDLEKKKSSDILRFSPKQLPYPDGEVRKPFPLGVNYNTLRDFANFYPIARACIEYRKTQITQLDWEIVPVELNQEELENDKNIENARKLKKFFKRPVGTKEFSYSKWLKEILEDLLVIDAVAIYKKKNRGGEITGYLPIDGATIELILEKDGTTPQPPAKAYVQKIGAKEICKLTTDELIYLMMTPRTYDAFGMSPIETLIITITTALKLQTFNLAYLCYDEETEILTKNGWKKFNDLTDRDIVATRNLEGKFEWQKPLKRVSFDYNDSLVRFKSKTVDLLVTPNHRMLVDYRGSAGKFADTGKNIIKRADWFLETPKSNSQNYLTPTTSKWKGKSPKYFELPDYVVERTGVFSGYAFAGRDKEGKPIRNKKKFVTEEKTTFYKKPSIKIPIKDWVAFLGIYIAEGWTRADNNQSRHDIYISQSKKSKKYQDIKNLLDRLPFDFKREEVNGTFFCADVRLWQILKPLGKSYQKYIPSDIKDYSTELLKILWEWMVKGDGHKQDNNITYTTTSKRLANDCQEILQKIGSDSRMYSVDQKPGNIIKKKLIKTTRLIYKVIERLAKHRSLSCANKEKYVGKVYSVKVPNGIVYIRRNGIPLWCGNTDGNVPEGFIELPQEIASSRDQLKEWQDAWDAMLSGNPQFQRKLKFLPSGMKYQPVRTPDDMTFERFEKWLLQNTCFDEQTEVLTEDGWEFFKDLDKNEKVATRSKDGNFKWQKPTHYQSYLYDGEMVEFKSKMVDLLVTPDHRMLTTYNHGKERGLSDYKIEKAIDLVNKDGHLVPLTSNWEGTYQKFFVLPKTNYVHGLSNGKKEVVKVPEVKIPINDWCAFLGIWLADGYARGNKGGSLPGTVSKTKNGTRKSTPYIVGIAQKKKATSILIEQLLDKLPFKWRKDKDCYIIQNISLWNYLFKLGNVYTKKVPKEILNLPTEQLKIIWEWYVLGDGYKVKTGKYQLTKDRETATSVNYNLLGNFQELLQKINFSGSVYKRPEKSYCIRGKKGKIQQGYTLSKRSSLHIKVNGRKKSYTGIVYDCTVPNGTLYVRRNGRPIWTGNCSVFGVQPNAIGFNFETNRSTSQTSYEVGKERGLFPTALWIKELMDVIVQDDFGHEELNFTWTNINPTNMAEEAEVVRSLVHGGLLAIDEWRIGENLKPIGAKDPFIMTPIGPIFVKDLAAQSDAGQMPILPYKPPGEAAQASQSAGEAVATPNVPSANTKQKFDNSEVVRELRRWRKVLMNDVKNESEFRDFKTDIIDLRTRDLIRNGLKKATSKEDIENVFSPFISTQHGFIPPLIDLYENINRAVNARQVAHPVPVATNTS